MLKSWEYGRFDIACEVSANRKAVYLNYLFWAGHDFSDSGIGRQEQEAFLDNLNKAWDFNHTEVP